MDDKTRYPLDWPAGWRRTSAEQRKFGQFGRVDRSGGWASRLDLTVHQAITRLHDELRRMGIQPEHTVLSTDLKLRRDGMPAADQRAPADPGAAIYWTDGPQSRCMAIDVYTKVEHNIAALAATIEAMRAIERHGGAVILDRAFVGFAALPAPEQWFQVLGVSAHASPTEIEEAYRKLAHKNHPDHGGDADAMARINRARDDGLEAARQ